MANTAEIKTAPKLTEVARAPELKRSAQDAAEVGTARVRALVEEGAAGAQKLMEKNVDQANKAAEGLFRAAEGAAEFGRGNVEAFAKATQVYVAGVLTNTPQNLTFWISNPKKADPRTAMPDLGVGADDARDIAAYLYRLP